MYSVEETESLEHLCPELAKEWDYERNAPLTPNKVTPQSSFKVWWINQNGERWRASVRNRYNKRGCPFSVGRVQYIGRSI